MRLKLATVAVMAILAAGVQPTHAGLVTFNSDPDGPKPNGFTSADSAVVHFTDSMGADLQTGFAGFFETNGTNALVIFGDDASQLIINFDVLVNSISLDFGNDNPGFVFAGDLGLLTLFNGVTQVGQASTVLNIDDLMNQSVAFAGVDFNKAVFAYTDPAGTPRNLIEVVDNIAFTESLAAVPEPSSLVLWGLGGIGLAVGANRRWRKKQTG